MSDGREVLFMRKTIMSIIDEAFEKHRDDEDLIREVVENLIHTCVQLRGEEGLRDIEECIDMERKRMIPR